MRVLFIIVCFLILPVATGLESFAQQHDASFEYVYVVDWPPELRADDTETPVGYDLLPFIDTLALGYAYMEEEGQPGLHFSLAWTPGPAGILNGERLPYEEMPEDIRIVDVDLRADVYVGGEPVAALMLSLDSLMLGARPDEAFFEKTDVAWNAVFTGVSEDEARASAEWVDGLRAGDAAHSSLAFSFK